jgi:hypothetical protein
MTQKIKLWRLSKKEDSVLNCRVPPLWLTYISERMTTFAKTYPIKVGAMENMLGNTLGT